jgi:hypothetical protein
MNRLVLVLVVLALLGSCIIGAGCQPSPEKEADTAVSENGTTTTTQTEDEAPVTTQTDDDTTQGSVWDFIPLSFRKTDLTEAGGEDRPNPVKISDWANTEWRYYHTPEALPTMRQYFTREMARNGWDSVESDEQVESSLNYWTRDSGANEAVVWMVPDEPGTFIAVSAK